MQKIIREKNLEFQKVFTSFPNCIVETVNGNENKWKVLSSIGLTWKEKSSRFGYIHEGKKILRIDIDYPVNSFSEKELVDYTGLPLKRNLHKSSISHINPTINGSQYDTIRLILYSDKLKNYNFNSEKFKLFLDEITKRNIP